MILLFRVQTSLCQIRVDAVSGILIMRPFLDATAVSLKRQQRRGREVEAGGVAVVEKNNCDSA
jgi:hypothetical protein